MEFKKLVTILATFAVFCCLSSTVVVAGETSNVNGDKDGKYRVVFEDNRTHERSKEFESHVEGNYLIVHYPEGEVRYRISEWFDMRTELVVSVYNNKTKRYMTGHLDDNSHFLHKETQDRIAKEQKEKLDRIKEKIKARKRQQEAAAKAARQSGTATPTNAKTSSTSATSATAPSASAPSATATSASAPSATATSASAPSATATSATATSATATSATPTASPSPSK